jgi:hypothetical protein
MMIEVLTIEHKNGVNVYAFSTSEKLQTFLESWVREWWPLELRDPIPELTRVDLIEAYFDKVNDREFYNTQSCELDET